MKYSLLLLGKSLGTTGRLVGKHAMHTLAVCMCHHQNIEYVYVDALVGVL